MSRSNNWTSLKVEDVVKVYYGKNSTACYTLLKINTIIEEKGFDQGHFKLDIWHHSKVNQIDFTIIDPKGLVKHGYYYEKIPTEVWYYLLILGEGWNSEILDDAISTFSTD